MRLFFIVDEFPFFLPDYLDETITRLKNDHEIVGITPLVTPKEQKTLYTYLQSQLIKLGPLSIFRLGMEVIKLKRNALFFQFHISKKPATIAQVAEKHLIKTVHTKKVNDPEYLKKLKKLKIDIIISSGSQIFKKDLLSLPKVCCINRHSGLLPSYGGLFPVFQAMIHDEKYAGTSVHKMVLGIDKGALLAQKRVKITPQSTLFGLYEKTYRDSVDVTVDAIHILQKKNSYRMKNNLKQSYYSFPSQADWDLFWKKKKRII